VNPVQRRASAALAGACAAAVLVVGVLAPAAFIGVPGASGGVAGAAMPGHIALPQPAPQLPAGSTAVGTAPAAHVLDLDVVLAGQNPSGLAQAVAAVSTPGSPQYRQYLTAAQYAAQYGPGAAEVAQVSSALRSEGLTVGSPEPGSLLLPVSGTASVVSAALGTPLESVQAPGDASRAIVNTASPQIPASLGGLVTGVVGLDGLVTEHSMIKQGHPGSVPPSGSSGSSGSGPSGSGASGSTASPEAQPPASGSTAQNPAAIAHVGTPQACGAAQGAAFGGTFTSTQLSSIFGLDQLLGQGRSGIGQSIAIVEFEQYAASDFAAFQACYGLSNPIRNVSIDGGPGGPAGGADGEAALDTEVAAVNAPSASLVVYEAPNGDDSNAFDLFNRIASDDSSQVVTTSWGVCEALMPTADRQTENGIFQRMALQGQTVIAASGDAGSEDCLPTNNSTQLAVDDPGSQPDVVSAGGTTMTSASASSQSVWNDCMGAGTTCARNSTLGAAGGGYSIEWPANPGQPPATGLNTTPCSLSNCRAVPDFSYPADPSAGGVAAYWDGRWTGFGGTSVAAPTNAGLFVDTNQGCFSRLGRVGPALYAAQQANGATFTDITQGNNDFTNTNLTQFAAAPGFDAASGLGTPVDPNLTLALQGADGCPSVAAVSPNTGPVNGAGAITIFGGGFANASSVTFGSAGAGRIVAQSATSVTVVPPNAGAAQCVDVTVGNSQGVSVQSAADHYGFGGNLNCGQGYRFVASDGGIFSYGDAGFYGSAGGSPLNAPVVGMADTPSSNGYWLVATDGGIFTYGDARFFGSMGGQHLNKPIVGMAATPDGGGYWLVASDGGIFSYGDAQFYGSTGGTNLNKPIVGMASTSDGNGYWLVASDGGIFAYGDAQFDGSTGSIHLNSPVVGMAAGPGGNGYWLVAADGGIFNYGSANFYGSAGSLHLNKPVVGMAATPNGQGYWLVASDGGIFTYGNTLFYGSTGGMQLNKPIVGMSSA
jgi:Pro-kumamolisin, activation domain/IPT/TIG domain